MHDLPAFRDYAQQAAVGILVTDPGGRTVWCNPAFTEMCGYTSDELVGKVPGSVLNGQRTCPDAVDRMARAVRGRRSFAETLVNYHKDGHPYWLAIQASPVLDDTGEPRFFVAMTHLLADLPSAVQSAGAPIEWPPLVPICAQCKKVRDRDGTWRRVESYLEGLGQDNLTHGLCRDCIDEWT